MNNLAHIGLKIDRISKKFNGVQVLKNINLQVLPGEVHGIVGENGAGKSTLIKILGGVYQPDQGDVRLNDTVLHLKSPTESISKGISIIYQELSLIPGLSVLENIFLGREIKKYGFVNSTHMRQNAKKVLDELDIQINPEEKVSHLNLAQSQMIEIAKGVSGNNTIIIMDEPTATLNTQEVEKLFSIIKRLKESGKSILYVSHRLHEIFEICDRVTVLRDGQLVNTWKIDEINESDLIKNMVGRELDRLSINKTEKKIDQVVLKLKNIKTRSLKKIDLELKKGEILGIGGLTGSGRSAIGRAIYGIDQLMEGEIILNEQVIKNPTPFKMVNKKVGLLPEDRKWDGLVMSMSLKENLSLAILKKLNKYGFISSTEEKDGATKYWKDLNIKSPSLNSLVQYFSGGNQQKVLIGRWLWFGCEVLIFDEPTRGIDIASRNEIYRILRDLSQEGMSIIVISSEYKELLEISDKILIMAKGKIAGEMDTQKEDLYSYMCLALKN